MGDFKKEFKQWQKDNPVGPPDAWSRFVRDGEALDEAAEKNKARQADPEEDE